MSHLMADINFSESKRDTFQTPGIKELKYCSYFVKKNDLSLHKARCSLKPTSSTSAPPSPRPVVYFKPTAY